MSREGHAMLSSVIADLMRMPGCSVVTTLQANLFFLLPCEVIRADSPAHEAILFDRLLGEVDAALVIAPETGNVLADRCRKVQSTSVASWNCSAAAIELCGDKFRLFQHLLNHRLPTIPTMMLELNEWPVGPFPFVLKPRDGAGSMLTYLINDRAEWAEAVNEICSAGADRNCLQQPYLRGQNLSVGVNISLDGRRIECLPVGEQHLSSDGRFRYRGGRIPAEINSTAARQIQELVVRTCRSIEGLAGYIGFDLLMTEKGEPFIVEINPRLTTAYVGYRQLSAEPLPAFWVSGVAPSHAPDRLNQRVEFTI